MKTSLKKIVAGASIATLVALNATFLTANAAAGEVSDIKFNGVAETSLNAIALDDDMTEIKFTAGTQLVAGGKIVITYPSNFVDADLDAVDITTTATNNAVITDASNVIDKDKNTITLTIGTGSDAADTILTTTIVADQLKTAADLPANKKNVLLTVETYGADNAADDIGGQLVYVGTANVVAITARVAPILNMEIKATPSAVTAVAGNDVTVAAGHHFQVGDTVDVIDADGSTVEVNDATVTAVAVNVLTLSADASAADNTSTVQLADPYAIGFGTLQVGASNIRKLDVDTASNAVSGITVALASTGLSGDNGKDIGGFGTNGTAASGTHDYRVVSATDNGGTIHAIATVAATQNILVAAEPTEANATTTVSLDATIDGSVEAGNYSDTLTFTVTGQF